jgi:hypothetical protein
VNSSPTSGGAWRTLSATQMSHKIRRKLFGHERHTWTSQSDMWKSAAWCTWTKAWVTDSQELPTIATRAVASSALAAFMAVIHGITVISNMGR